MNLTGFWFGFLNIHHLSYNYVDTSILENNAYKNAANFMNSTGIEHLLKHFSCAVTPYSWDQINDIKLFGLFFRDLFPCASISLQVQLIIVLHRKIWIKFRNAIYVRQLKWIEFDSFSVFFLSFHPAIYIRDNDSAIICCFITVTVSFVLQIASLIHGVRNVSHYITS